MRLRNNCTGHTRATRHALRMALSMALCSSTWTNIYAETPPANLPAQLQHETAPALDLLPYPFAKATASAQPVAKCEVSDRAAASRQLVKLLGLEPRDQTGLAKTEATRAPHLPMLTRSTSTAQTLRASNSSVVMASATEEQRLTAKLAASPVLPKLPTPPARTTSAPQPGPESATKLEITPSESLLDIEIPLSLSIQPPVVPGKTTHNQTTAVAAPKTGPAAMGQCPSQTSGVAGGIVQTCEPPQLVGSESILSAPQAKLETGSKQPELVRPTKPVSLTVGGRAQPAVSGPVSMNLNDSSDAPTVNKAKTAGRGVVLHLSSGSDDAEIKADVPSAMPKPGLQIRIEGEPVPVLSNARNQSDSVLQSAASLPLKPATGQSARQPSVATIPAQPVSTNNPLEPVKAILASRVTPVIAQDSQVESQVRLPNGSPLNVGLQESATLSTDYSIAELSVEHPNICQLLKTGDRSISVIGMRPGTTRIALISYDSQGERAVEVREVAVGESAPTEVNLPELVNEISLTVKQMYPKSDVQITAYQDYVIVRGYTNYESDAKKILSLVRKTSLFPVVDQLTTSGN